MDDYLDSDAFLDDDETELPLEEELDTDTLDFEEDFDDDVFV